MDVARILARTEEELAQTDIAEYALEALANSNIKRIYILGRRGPAQAAFTTPEIKELGELQDADIFVPPEEAKLDTLSHEMMAAGTDRGTARKVQIIQSYASNQPSGKSKEIFLRLLVSPVEMYGDENGRLSGIRLVHNELYATEAGTLRPRATERFEDIEGGIAFRSVGYRGVPLSGVPFNDSWGVILNEDGRVIDPDSEKPVLGEYTAGWIKRGPSGVIGTNKPDALETVEKMVIDLAEGRVLNPAHPTADEAEELVRQRQPNFFSFADWEKLDAIEVARGEALGRPRLKFTSLEAMLEAADKQTAQPVA